MASEVTKADTKAIIPVLDSIRTLYNTIVPDTKAGKQVVLDRNDNPIISSDTKKVLMRYPDLKDKDGNLVYSSNCLVQYLTAELEEGEYDLPATLTSSQILKFHELRKADDLVLKFVPDTDYEINPDSPPYPRVLVDKKTKAETRVCMVNYRPMRQSKLTSFSLSEL